MITKEQIEKYCKQNNSHFSKLLFATLDHDYQANTVLYDKWLNITIPAGTIVQVCLYTNNEADLYVNGECVTANLSYSAATLLEDE